MHEALNMSGIASPQESKRVPNLPASVHEDIEEVYDEVRTLLDRGEAPLSVGQSLVDAIIWLKKDKTKNSAELLEKMRERWVAPYAMEYGPAYEVALELSSILDSDPSDPHAYMYSVYRDLAAQVRMRQHEAFMRQKQEDFLAEYETRRAIEEMAENVYESAKRGGLKAPPEVRRYAAPRELPHEMDVYEERARQSEGYIRTLLRLKRPVVLNETLSTHITRLLEGGGSWIDKMDLYAPDLMTRMNESDRRAFERMMGYVSLDEQENIPVEIEGEEIPIEMGEEDVLVEYEEAPRHSGFRRVVESITSKINALLRRKAA